MELFSEQLSPVVAVWVNKISSVFSLVQWVAFIGPLEDGTTKVENICVAFFLQLAGKFSRPVTYRAIDNYFAVNGSAHVFN